MPRLKENQVPSYRLHKQSGQAVVTLNGKDMLLGKFNSRVSKDEYRRLTAEWQSTRGAASLASTSHARHHATNSIGSIRRSPTSTL